MGKFKVGDRVRVIDDAGGGKIGDECTVKEIGDDGYYVLDGLTGGAYGLFDRRLELVPAAWPPKVGYRVIATADPDDPGTITGFNGLKYSVHWDSHVTASNLCIWSLAELSPLPAPATFTIEAGKFYKTRDGRKVGPLRDDWEDDATYKYHVTEGVLNYALWDVSGTHYLGRNSHRDLIAEWVEEPAVAPVEVAASNDNRADAGGGFKDGDRIRCISNPAGQYCRIGDEFVAIARGEQDGYPSSVHYAEKDGTTTWRPGTYFELVVTQPTAIRRPDRERPASPEPQALRPRERRIGHQGSRASCRHPSRQAVRHLRAGRHSRDGCAGIWPRMAEPGRPWREDPGHQGAASD
jgi:hypothetical protein